MPVLRKKIANQFCDRVRSSSVAKCVALRMLDLGLWRITFIGKGAWRGEEFILIAPEDQQGPALFALAAGEWIMPLLVLEAYLRVEKSCNSTGRYVVAALLVMLAAGTGFGVYRAAMDMWLPPLFSQ
ncbi:MAG TPA: hypothetical protein VJP80_00195 [Candidatus Saccharimonadales bacterium]|nr:hypothetical protein [Candidatus Saccharimonadales bacterium]